VNGGRGGTHGSEANFFIIEKSKKLKGSLQKKMKKLTTKKGKIQWVSEGSKATRVNDYEKERRRGSPRATKRLTEGSPLLRAWKTCGRQKRIRAKFLNTRRAFHPHERCERRPTKMGREGGGRNYEFWEMKVPL